MQSRPGPRRIQSERSRCCAWWVVSLTGRDLAGRRGKTHACLQERSGVIGRVRETWRSPQDRGLVSQYEAQDPEQDLADHINALERLVSPDRDGRLKELRDIMERRNLEAHATLFWHGPPGARHPAIPSSATEVLRRLPADIERDFANGDC
jgi:hypothetical protein